MKKILLLVLLFCSCKVSQVPNIKFELNSFYGFIVIADKRMDRFFMVDRTTMLAYMTKQQADSAKMINDLKKAHWVAEVRKGFAYNSYVWYYFIHTNEQQKFHIDIREEDIDGRCGKLYYSIIPVYVTTLDRPKIIEYKRGKRNHFFYKTLRTRERLNISYIEPLNTELFNQFILFHDNFDRQPYFDYLKFWHIK